MAIYYKECPERAIPYLQNWNCLSVHVRIEKSHRASAWVAAANSCQEPTSGRMRNYIGRGSWRAALPVARGRRSRLRRRTLTLLYCSEKTATNFDRDNVSYV